LLGKKGYVDVDVDVDKATCRSMLFCDPSAAKIDEGGIDSELSEHLKKILLVLQNKTSVSRLRINSTLYT